MRFAIVIFPGSNCETDVYHVLKGMGYQVEFLWHKECSLNGFEKEDWIILPGGFSYGDYLRCGAIAKFSPMMQEVIRFANNGGKVLGICNGFQILCESGLLPGALLKNHTQNYICKNQTIRSEESGVICTIPIAHGEGRFYASNKVLSEIASNNQILYRYSNSLGEISEEANPNGSLQNIAAICNAGKNVFGMMPHPERACSTILGNTDGLSIFNEIGIPNT